MVIVEFDSSFQGTYSNRMSKEMEKTSLAI